MIWKNPRNTVNYLRLLGATEKGREYLKQNKKNFTLPVISKLSAYSDPDLDLDIKASRIYALGQNGKCQEELLREEFSRPPIML
jgi:hypothetical protein